jgi:BirA family biotin operon repressor/biotin-[acetyl-CoA-carboxylase] ligase
LESIGVGQGVSHLAIGFGINLVAAPSADQVEDGAVRPVSLLSETGANITPEEFLTLLAASYARFEAQFTTYGFAPIREAWLRHAARLGEVITARIGSTVSGTKKTVGTFETVDATGNLVLSTEKGRVAIAAADVFF